MPAADPVGAVLLAAGASTRFGPANKLLADVQGRPMIRRTAETLRQAIDGPLIVVTGFEAELIEAALDGLSVGFCRNPGWRDGMGSSVAAGIAALPDACSGAFILPGDIPHLTPALLARMCAAFDGDTILFPVTGDGQQRNPVLWPRRYFPELRSLSGTAGAKALLARHRDGARPVQASDAELADIDTQEALRGAVLR